MHTALPELGLEPHLLDDATIEGLIALARENRGRVNTSLICNSPSWK